MREISDASEKFTQLVIRRYVGTRGEILNLCRCTFTAFTEVDFRASYFLRADMKFQSEECN